MENTQREYLLSIGAIRTSLMEPAAKLEQSTVGQTGWESWLKNIIIFKMQRKKKDSCNWIFDS